LLSDFSVVLGLLSKFLWLFCVGYVRDEANGKILASLASGNARRNFFRHLYRLIDISAFVDLVLFASAYFQALSFLVEFLNAFPN